MSNFNKLSNRQTEILESVSLGLSNAEIAEQFSISVNTVKNHVASIFKLLEVKTRAEAIRLYKEHEALKHDFTNTKIQLVIIHHAELNSKHAVYAQTLRKYLSSWGVFVADIRSDQKAENNLSNYAYQIEFSVYKESNNLNEYSWSIKRHKNNKRYFNEVNYFELLRDEVDRHDLIDIANQIYQALLVDIISQPHLATQHNDIVIKLISALYYFDQSDKSILVTADQLCDDVIKAAPNNSTAQGLKALILYRRMSYFQIEMGEANFALLSAHALTAIKLGENNMWAQAAFAYHNLIHSKMNLAEKHFERSLEINPCYYISAKMLAQVYCFNDKADKGITLIEDTIQNYSNLSTSSNFYTSLTILYYCAEQYKKAKDVAKKGLIYQDSNVAALLVALISLSEINQEYDELEKYKLAFAKLEIEPQQLLSRLSLTRKMVPESAYNIFTQSIKRAGLDFGKL